MRTLQWRTVVTGVVLLALVSAAVGQETKALGPYDAIRPLEGFVGSWTGDYTPAGGPAGTIYGKCALSGFNSLLRFQWDFKPGAPNAKPIPVLDVVVGLNGKTKRLHFWVHSMRGHAEGEAHFERNTLTLRGGGVDFNGVEGSRLVTYTLKGRQLVVEQTDIMQGGKRLPDEPVMRLVRDESAPGADVATVDQSTEQDSDQLLEEIQGTWEVKHSNGSRTVKTLRGNKTTLTRYDKDGNVTAAHKSECRLSIHNGVKVHSITAMEFTEGPQKGLVVPKTFLGDAGYIYVIDGDTWVEARGLMTRPDGKARLIRWKRVKSSAD